MIINAFMTETTPPKFFKAPKGFMYEIFDIHFSILVGGSNGIGVVPYQLEDEVVFLSTTTSEFLAFMPTDIAGNIADFAFTKGEKTKYITIAIQDSTAIGVIIIIHYELTHASRTELILEWFRKGR